jgi:geranylgeranyl reductase family protein
VQRPDAVVVGGGPAGSTCAWSLRRAGMDVLVLDRARFPRDKPCAGWVTPQAIAALELDLEDYASQRVLQPVRGFLTSRLGGPAARIRYDDVVSYGVRRCEFDDYLLRRSGARVEGRDVRSVQRDPDGWRIDDGIRTPVLIGAGGHFCPVARALGARPTRGKPLVVAQEIEFRMTADEERGSPVAADMPELYFCRDLEGYGWIFRKQGYMNVGIGRRDAQGFPSHVRDFWRMLFSDRRVSEGNAPPWPGHAYLVHHGPARSPVDDGVLLVGDAAGLAYPQSGEGIAPAIESGRLAAATILAAGGVFEQERLEPYRRALDSRLGKPPAHDAVSLVPGPLRSLLAGALLGNASLSRFLFVDPSFLHRRQPPLAQPAAYLGGIPGA